MHRINVSHKQIMLLTAVMLSVICLVSAKPAHAQSVYLYAVKAQPQYAPAWDVFNTADFAPWDRCWSSVTYFIPNGSGAPVKITDASVMRFPTGSTVVFYCGRWANYTFYAEDTFWLDPSHQRDPPVDTNTVSTPGWK